MHILSAAVGVVFVVAETGHVPRVPVEKLNLGDAVVFSDDSRNADGTTGRESSNRGFTLLPDDSGEHLMRIGPI